MPMIRDIKFYTGVGFGEHRKTDVDSYCGKSFNAVVPDHKFG